MILGFFDIIFNESNFRKLIAAKIKLKKLRSKDLLSHSELP